MIKKFMADKLIINFQEYTKIVEKLAIQIPKVINQQFSWNYEGSSANN